MEENLMEKPRNRFLFLKNNYFIEYLESVCHENVDVQIVDNLSHCAGLTYQYKKQYTILLAPNKKESMLVFSILHELSHIELGFLGSRYEKKSESSIYEKIINIHLVVKNRKLFDKKSFLKYVLLGLISEKALVNSIKFKEHL